MEVQIAYLGPPGTYGERAARHFADRIPKLTVLAPCPTITSIYNHPSEYLVMPLENTIHGSVTETIDCLLSPLSASALAQGLLNDPSHGRGHGDGSERNGKGDGLKKGDSSGQGGPSKRRKSSSPPRDHAVNGTEGRYPVIIDEVVLGIQHCLVVKKGTKMRDIKWIRSHEQALGQCKRFIESHLDNPNLIKWASTAGAAMSLLGNDDDVTGYGPSAEEKGEGAAICSKTLVEHCSELEILEEGIQDVRDNYTRFVLLSRSENRDIAIQTCVPSHFQLHIEQTEPSRAGGRSRLLFYALPTPSLLHLIINSRIGIEKGDRSTTQNEILRIHSRPRPTGVMSETKPDSFAVNGENNGFGKAPGEGEESNSARPQFQREKFPTYLLVESRSIWSGGVDQYRLIERDELEKRGVVSLGGFSS